MTLSCVLISLNFFILLVSSLGLVMEKTINCAAAVLDSRGSCKALLGHGSLSKSPCTVITYWRLGGSNNRN